MPNLAIGLCIGLAAWTICMGSTALSVGSGPEETKILPSFVTTSFTDSRNVKQKNQELPCIGGLFGEIKWDTKDSQIDPLNNENNVEGCLAVWWEKETYDEEKWKGSWNLLLGMKDDKYGIIFSQNIRTENGKLILDSSFYNLNNKSSEWSLISEDVYYGKDSEKEIEKENIDKKMLLPKNETVKKSDKWSFDFKLGEICPSDNSCASDAPANKYLNSVWNFVPESKSGGTNFIYEWFEDIDSLSCGGDTIKLRLLKVKGSFELIT